MKIVRTVAELRAAIAQWRSQGARIAFVPTMGNLHDGHLHLVSAARKTADRVVVSIFVNPAQFCPGEDFATYPRTPEQDVRKLLAAGVDLLFLPEVAEIYPGDPSATTCVEVPALSVTLCGQFRPGHFRGVATVVCKLLNMVQPDAALFGEKDYQQLVVIKRMAADLNLPVTIVGVPTVREPSGLAMSSRNAYLSEAEKAQAALIFATLNDAASALRAGERDFTKLEGRCVQTLLDAGFRPDYFAIRRPFDLNPPTPDDTAFVILAAAWLGRARLIDNISLYLAEVP